MEERLRAKSRPQVLVVFRSLGLSEWGTAKNIRPCAISFNTQLICHDIRFSGVLHYRSVADSRFAWFRMEIFKGNIREHSVGNRK